MTSAKDEPPDYNPFLKPRDRLQSDSSARRGTIDVPGKVANMVWQTRPAPPTEYECRLGDALEQVFAAGAAELSEVVAKLNELGMRTRDGGQWTAESLQAELARLAA